jgi:dienelactone hydrolase
MRDDSPVLPGTEPLTIEGDLAAQVVAGLDRFLTRELAHSIEHRAARWQRDFSSHECYTRSVAPNRQRFQRIIGAVDPREGGDALELVATTAEPALVGSGAGYEVFAVRWPVLPGVQGEGLLLQPEGEAMANVVALPDCDWTPEMLAGLVPGVAPEAQFARRLAENGCRVLVPLLMDRRDTYSGAPEIRMTNQPHREFLYRAAFEMGRHLIGFEVQKVLAAVDALTAGSSSPPRQTHLAPLGVCPSSPRRVPTGVIGCGEGGLLALYSAAVDERIDAAAVCGYFAPRDEVWREPIYRNVWGLLTEFGDAELASLVAPRALVIEACRGPEVDVPPQTPGRSDATPGVLTTPLLEEVRAEVERARDLVKGLSPPAPIELVVSGGGDGPPGTDAALAAFLRALGVPRALVPSGAAPTHRRSTFDPEPRFRRQFAQLLEQTQRLMRDAEFRRAAFWAKADATSVATWQESARSYREYLWDEVIGRFPPASLPPNARSRQVADEARYRGYEVVLDVWPDVFAYGILLVPKDLKPGERRPVVVCQHGLEGRPQDVANPQVDNPGYRQFACKLAERGFVTYAPQNPYIGEDSFRVLQRKANPLGKSLFAPIVRQHERTLEWLVAQPFVDPQRIAFYGLSYGGVTALRVPALLEGYCLSICSANFNEWVWMNVSARHANSYLFTPQYEMPDFDLGNTFNHAELSWMICPRPFMVERGHHDGVAPDEWVAYEYARTHRRYDLLGLGDRTEIEFFDGPHAIHGEGTFAFLHRHLNWPAPH